MVLVVVIEGGLKWDFKIIKMSTLALISGLVSMQVTRQTKTFLATLLRFLDSPLALYFEIGFNSRQTKFSKIYILTGQQSTLSF